MQGGASLLRCADKKKLLSELVIYRILCLVIVLDRVPKQMQLPQEAPFIFRLSATLKSSEDILNDCLQCSLAGIGKLSRHLSKASYVVDLKQRDVDEWKTDVVSLAADLSNGIVLCKLVTVLFGSVCLGPSCVRGLQTCEQPHSCLWIPWYSDALVPVDTTTVAVWARRQRHISHGAERHVRGA
jgi:hypothetical protein